MSVIEVVLLEDRPENCPYCGKAPVWRKVRLPAGIIDRPKKYYKCSSGCGLVGSRGTSMPQAVKGWNYQVEQWRRSKGNES